MSANENLDWEETCAKCMDGEIEPRQCEYYGEPNGCNSPTYGEPPPIVNAAAMREALVWMSERMNAAVHDGSFDCYEALRKIEAALSAPARNCDMPYKDRVEMYGAFKDWCKAKGHRMEPMLAYDAFDWLLAPAAERKGEGDGK